MIFDDFASSSQNDIEEFTYVDLDFYMKLSSTSSPIVKKTFDMIELKIIHYIEETSAATTDAESENLKIEHFISSSFTLFFIESSTSVNVTNVQLNNQLDEHNIRSRRNRDELVNYAKSANS